MESKNILYLIGVVAFALGVLAVLEQLHKFTMPDFIPPLLFTWALTIAAVFGGGALLISPGGNNNQNVLRFTGLVLLAAGVIRILQPDMINQWTASFISPDVFAWGISIGALLGGIGVFIYAKEKY